VTYFARSYLLLCPLSAIKGIYHRGPINAGHKEDESFRDYFLMLVALRALLNRVQELTVISMHILYCDDDMDDVEAFTHAIGSIDSSIGCEIAFDGTEALEMLLNRKFRPDAIFIDLHMPKLGGEELVMALRSNDNLKSVPLIIVSSSIEKKLIEHFNNIGVNLFLCKSIQECHLHDAIRSILVRLPGDQLVVRDRLQQMALSSTLIEGLHSKP
jgi:CheY-like chemotaxis protein